MEQQLNTNDAKKVALEIVAEIRALPVRNTPNVRVIRRKYSRMLKKANPEFILDLARSFLRITTSVGLPVS